MWKIKQCNRCGGDVYVDTDEGMLFDHCLQCGYESQHPRAGCPRCGGEMYLDTEDGDWFYRCRRCGYIGEMHSLAIKKQEDAFLNKS